MPADAPATAAIEPAPAPKQADAQDVTRAGPAQAGAISVPRPGLMDRLDVFISRLSTRNSFWQRVCSLIWLPYAAKSGIQMKRVDESTFSAVLPFRRFNKNWYSAMAGGALLANAEIAGGMYAFSACGGEFTVVCKQLEYKFLRPCFGPAVYKITPREDLPALVASGKEFNLTLDMDIVQQSLIPEKIRPGAEAVLPRAVGEKVASKEKRVGRCTAVFHVTPKAHQQSKGRKIRP